MELTGDNVTECLGGAEAILEENLDTAYETMCDRAQRPPVARSAYRAAELLRH
ncbi:MAG: 3-deoxy-7-phosphoheptulonate synthase [Acidimicrobiales bacterium]